MDLEKDCPLLTNDHQDLVDLFNVVWDVVNCDDAGLRQHLAKSVWLEDKKHNKISVEVVLQDVRETLCRIRYRIGFVGTYQIGKTCAVNSILGIDLLAEGGSGACTSVATLVSTQKDEGPPQFQVRYFSLEELQRRFRDVSGMQDPQCPVTELPEPSSPEAAQFSQWVNGYRSKDNTREISKKDVAFLHELVTQFHSGGSTALDTEINWKSCKDGDDLKARLDRLVKHQYTADGLPLDAAFPALMKEVRVRIHLTNVSHGLELIDLPGLGNIHSYDAELTKRYTQSLDGVLFFSKSGTPEDEELGELLKQLQLARDVLDGRCYRVVTRVDEAGANNLYGSSYFTALSNANAAFGLRDHATRLLARKGRHGNANVYVEKIPKERLSDALGVLRKEDGQLILPESDLSFGSFRSAFEEYAIDGGLNALKVMLDEDIRESVQLAVCGEARSKLSQLHEKTLNCVRTALKGGISREEVEIARSLSSEMLKCSQNLVPGGFDLNDTAAGKFFKECWIKLENHITVDSVQAAQDRDRRPNSNAGADLGQSRWVSLHKSFAADIHSVCQGSLPDVAHDFFRAYSNQLLQRCQNVPSLKPLTDFSENRSQSEMLPKSLNPFEQFKLDADQIASSIQQMNSGDEAGPVVGGILNDLNQLGSTSTIQDQQTGKLHLEHKPSMYVNLMKRKIEAFAYQQIARIRRHVSKCSLRLEAELNQVAQGSNDLTGNLKPAQKKLLLDKEKKLLAFGPTTK